MKDKNPDQLLDFDKAFDQMTNAMNNAFDKFGDQFNDSIEDTMSSTIPSLFHSGWSSLPFHRRCHGHRDQDSKEELSVYAKQRKAADSSYVQELDQLPEKLDLARKLWAYPIPSPSQYEKCHELEGSSVWTRDGVWRCLFPADSRAFERQVYIGSSSGAPVSERKWFKDYSIYLDWKTQMRKAIMEQAQNQRQEHEHKWSRHRERSVDRTNRFGERPESFPPAVTSAVASPAQTTPAQTTPAQTTPSQTPLSKYVTSSSVTVETLSAQDGNVETKRTERKWYSDGTSSVSETVNSAPINGSVQQSARPEVHKPVESPESKGWFWR